METATDPTPRSREYRLSRERPLDAIVIPIARQLQVVSDIGLFAIRSMRSLRRALRYRAEILAHASDVAIGSGAVLIGAGSLFVILAISFFAGTNVGLQGYAALSQIGAESLSGVVAALGNIREVAPLVAGVALAAQVGSSFTAELGAQRMSEEIDALEVIGTDTYVYLIGTRIWAVLLTMVPLYLGGVFAAFLATELVVVHFYGLSAGVYDHYFALFLPITDVVASFAKAIFFAILVAVVHCYYGYFATGGPAGVGAATGRAIRLSIVLIVLCNLFISLLIWGPRITARIVG